MAIQGDRVLTVKWPNSSATGEFETGIAEVDTFLRAIGETEEARLEKIRELVEPHKQRIMKYGFSDEDAEEQIQKLIEKEIVLIPEIPIEVKE